VFNLSGSEIVVILLAALVVLGPEKLPEAIRRFGRVYGEVKRVSKGFQSEFTQAFQEPLNELKETARMTKEAVTSGFEDGNPKADVKPNFGSTADAKSTPPDAVNPPADAVIPPADAVIPPADAGIPPADAGDRPTGGH
jgi:sec-independent protein translocase protein TatB